MPAQRPQRGGRELLTRGGSGRAQAGTTPTLALEPAVGREDAPVAEAAHTGQGRGGGSPRPGAGLEGAPCAAGVEVLRGDGVVALGTLVVHVQPLGK